MPFRFRQNKESESLRLHADTIEKILSAIDVNPNEARNHSEDGYQWKFEWGSALVEVLVSERGGKGYFQVFAPLFYLPEKGREPLYQAMLEHNLEMTTAALGLHEDVVYVFSERPLDNMITEEARQIITLVAYYADLLDDKLISEFGGKLY
ncbi:MAG: YbjN domain-containing protein [Anaerolineae bacterium]|jgi:hypothetical protein|nr:YbjN domain-containing protein [Anaerolineae bacterium]